ARLHVVGLALRAREMRAAIRLHRARRVTAGVGDRELVAPQRDGGGERDGVRTSWAAARWRLLGDRVARDRAEVVRRRARRRGNEQRQHTREEERDGEEDDVAPIDRPPLSRHELLPVATGSPQSAKSRSCPPLTAKWNSRGPLLPAAVPSTVNVKVSGTVVVSPSLV